MAFEKWKSENGEWNTPIVAVVAFCGVLLYLGLYYYLTEDRHSANVKNFIRDNALTSTTGSGTRYLDDVSNSGEPRKW